MTKTREAFTSPVGRLVQGDAFVPQTKDQQGNLRVVKSGPNIGQPNPQYFVAIAVPKIDPNNPSQWNPEYAAFYALLDKVARQEWPALFPNGGACVNPMFAWKVKDGDGVDRNGKSNADKEGFPGHWVISFASSYAPKVVRPTSPGVWETLTDPQSLKRGYYVRIAGSITGNDSPQTPGLYTNLDMIELVGYGQEIVGGPDAATAFAAPATLPAGASAQPIAGATMPAGTPPGAPGGPGMMPPPGGAPGAPGAVDAPPAAPGGQYTGYMGVPGAAPGAPAAPLGAPTAGVPSSPGGVPSAPPATNSPTRTMTALAGTNTYESFVGAGWTDQQLIEKGYMVVA